MADDTGVEWADATWPIVQGCDPVSQGCVGCYVVPLLWRMMHNPNARISAPLQGLVEYHENAGGERKLRFTGKVVLREDRLDWPLKWTRPRKIFVPSHGDIFHKAVPDSFLDRIFAVMALCPQHTFQVLTKRPERMREYLTNPETPFHRIHSEAAVADDPAEWEWICGHGAAITPYNLYLERPFPLPNVWTGFSAEDQPNFEGRWSAMRDLARAGWLTWCSAEPLLGWLDATAALREGLRWIVMGGESGQHARPHNISWDRSLIDQCKAAGVPCFEKQLGRRPYWDCLNGLGRWAPHVRFTRIKIDGHPADAITLRDPKGGDWREWPRDLRVREFPGGLP